MRRISASDYIDVMKPWLAKLPEFLRTSEYNPGLTCYGTGESAHWPIQSNCNVFAALAVLGTAPELPENERAGVRETALALLRYALATHLTGSDKASDGRQWGHHWISVLGLERMSHGVNAIRDFLSDADREGLRRVMISESDWLLDSYPVEAAMIDATGPNKPESNIWNGGMLLRTAVDYPDAPRAAEYLEKATKFLLNGLSHPLDAACETKFRNRPVREWHVGFNFTPNWSLDHHSYLNVGYMVISLSNLAMLHFYFKDRGITPPPELYWHLRELWGLVKKFTFSDGRLLRIGGDTRARYTYCQNYAIPVWLLAADLFDDGDAAQFERNWLDIVRKETTYTGDGGFYGRRLDNIRRINYYYYARLESDAILCLSYGAYWRRRFKIRDHADTFEINPRFAWQDEFHGATFNRSGNAVRSFVWHAAQGPTGLCVPADESSMAEWQNNLHGELLSTQTPVLTQGESDHRLFEGGFINWGAADWQERNPLGEGEGVYSYARHRIAVAALPDAKTMIVLEYARITKEITLDMVKTACVKLPNDLFNGSMRTYHAPGHPDLELRGNPGCEDNHTIFADRLGIDGKMNLFHIYGCDGFTIHRPAQPSIRLHKPHGPWLTSLYADEICGGVSLENRRYRPGAVLLDDGFAAAAGGTLSEPAFRVIPQAGLLRLVEFVSEGRSYLFAANFGEAAAIPELPYEAELLAGSPGLPPGTAALWRR